MPRGCEGRGEAEHEEEALLTGSRCRCPEVTTCPRLCNAGGAPGELQAEGEAGGGLTAPSLSRRSGLPQPGAPAPWTGWCAQLQRASGPDVLHA